MPVIQKCAAERILILDGAMGTMIQRYGLSEADFRGERFKDHDCDLKGNNDILNITRPEVITDVHRQYLEAGADLIETNTFNSTLISQQDYHLDLELVKELNYSGAKLAREAADKFSTSDKPRFVCGIIGPTSKSASISPDVNDPAKRDITFDDLVAAYSIAAESLWRGGADALMVETIFDTLNAKAAVYAICQVSKRLQVEIPIMISGTITDQSGRTLSGQTPAAFWASLQHTPNLVSIGLNCALGAKQLKRHISELANLAHVLISAHPNAGLPNEMGGYDATPESFCNEVSEFMAEGLVNIVGGCCGTTPDYIAALAEASKQYKPHKLKAKTRSLLVSGLEPLWIGSDNRSNFINIGERTNVAGSRKFLRLIKERDFSSALSIARNQVQAGAAVIDINMDDGLLDGKECMTTFLNLLAGEPDIAKVPIMIDSSKWEIISAALRCVQGKCIVNSSSLKHGEKEFLEQAEEVALCGAALVVMAFDEEGQATTYERKIAVCERAYKLLCQHGFNPADIIFDPNVLTVATGIEEHNNYGLAFIEAVRWIKQNLPYAKVSAGVSNVSFAFRGNDYVRGAMHAVFLYHAIAAGLDMGIVNAAQLMLYDDIPNQLRDEVEDVLLNRRPDASERLLNSAAQLKEAGAKLVSNNTTDELAWRKLPVNERLSYAMLKGVEDFIAEDIKEALTLYPSSLAIIEGPLMMGMNQVGDLFGAGKMFLPQVVKSARVMKSAVSCLMPVIEEEKKRNPENSSGAGKFIIATVKGDVHDIGKNIVSVVLACNGFEIIDLGVMVPCENIIEAAKQDNVVAVGLSGLITPSLDEMVRVASEMEKNGLTMPLVIGGATTSPLHTALKIAPQYSHGVIYVPDASRMVPVLKKISNPQIKGAFLAEVAREQAELRAAYSEQRQASLTLEEARNNKYLCNWKEFTPLHPKSYFELYYQDFPLKELVPEIDWMWFLSAWGLKGTYPEILESHRYGKEAKTLMADAKELLDKIVADRLLMARGVAALFPANSVDEDVEIYSDDSRKNIIEVIHTVRDLVDHSAVSSDDIHRKSNPALADFVAPKDLKIPDYIGGFAVTAGHGDEKLLEKYNGDDYHAIMIKTISDRLAEAFSEVMQRKFFQELLGITQPTGIRPAIGYPISPNHADKEKLFNLLNAKERTGIALTENYAMSPASSVCGWYFMNSESWYFK